MRILSLAIVATLGCTGPAQAQSVADQLEAATEKIGLSGKKGPSLLQPGFAVGEYGGFSKSMNKSFRAAGSWSSDSVAASITITSPSFTADVTGECGGKQGRLGLGWITFKRDGMDYVCNYAGGAPAGSELNVAMARGKGIVNRMMQDQREGEIQYGDITLRVRTEHLGGIPFGSGGAPVSYVVTRPDGTIIGGLNTGGMRPMFYLPKDKGPERDAVAVLTLSLFVGRDPGDDRRRF